MTAEQSGPEGLTARDVPAAILAQAEAAIAGAEADPDESPPPSAHGPSHETPMNNYNGTHATMEDNLGEQLPEEEIPAYSEVQGPSDLPVPSHLMPPASSDPAPAYSATPEQIQISQPGLDTKARVTDDGRVNININSSGRRLQNLLVPALRSQLNYCAEEEDKNPLPPGYIPPALGGLPGQDPPPPLNVVMHVVGSRGDVQPFVALGKTLQSTYGHRVRLATHPTFQSFVEENGLEFFSIGGDPAELMAFMVKNPGLMPGIDSLKSGDVGKRRKGMEEIILGCWRSCIEVGDGLGAPARLSNDDDHINFANAVNLDASPTDRPFIADAIIANPPSFAHVHIAEKLGIPLHLMFTMPWSPTQAFPHPLANIQSTNADDNLTNFVSYVLVEMMTWQGLGDIVNRFREKALDLEPISTLWAPGILTRLRIPYTYCWSPALIPKPRDWGQNISISGFYFLDLASNYNPQPELQEFLASGAPPVYIGFGSIVVDDPNALTKMIFEAVKKVGVRALVSKGWGGLGADELGAQEGVFMLGNVPHDWLFKHVAAVVHHGGAGTTAAGIQCGRPTVIVPFFGDQPFWGNMVHRSGAGPAPIPFRFLTVDNLAAAIEEALKPETLLRAQELGARIREEKGTEVGGKSFHDRLNVDQLRCSVAPSRAAVWRVKRTQTRLSALAATVLANEGLLDFGDLKLYRPREYTTESGPFEPVSGAASALLGTFLTMTMGVADFPVEIFKAFKGKSASSKQDSLSSSHGLEKTGSTPSITPSQSITEAPMETTAEPQMIDYSALGSVDMASVDTALASPPESTTSLRAQGASQASNVASSDTTTESATSSTKPSTTSRGGAMRQALTGIKNRSRSASRERKACASTFSPAERARNYDPSNINLGTTIAVSKGVGRIVGAGLKSPMDFALGIARGFHNAPKLYGDDTVRPQEKITDLQSGLKASAKEFGFGLYDGISGLVTQPYRGAVKDGPAGLIKGFAKGIGGVVFKPGAALWGLPGYTFMGIHQEIRKLFGTSVNNYIIAARTAQGYEHWQYSSPEERADIIARWQKGKNVLQSARQRVLAGGPEGQEEGRLSPRGFLQTRHLSFDERRKLHDQRKVRRTEEKGKTVDRHRRSDSGSVLSPQSSVNEADEFEQAIQASVAATSRGNPEEDEVLERAIRASMAQLQDASDNSLTDEEALRRAVQASVAEINRGAESGEGLSSAEADHNAMLEKSIQASLLEFQAMREHADDVDTEDDEDIKQALEHSKATAENAIVDDDDDDEVQKAIQQSKTLHDEQMKAISADTPDDDEQVRRILQESKKLHEETMQARASAHGPDDDEEVKRIMEESKAIHEERALKSQNEEDTVLEYIKKQSLLEEENRKNMLEKQKEFGAVGDDDELQRAIEASMNLDPNVAGQASSSSRS